MDRTQRSSVGGQRATTMSALERMKAARAGGASRLDQVSLADDGDIYEEVDEEQYKNIVLERRQAGEFVIDDGDNSGYVDDGEEHWEEYMTEETRGPNAKKQKTGKVARPTGALNVRKKGLILPTNDRVSGAFLGAGRSVGSAPGSTAAAISETDQNFVADLLAEYENEQDEDEDMDEEDASKLKDLSMLGGNDAFADRLMQVYEEDEKMARVITRAHNKVTPAQRKAQAAQNWDVLPPSKQDEYQPINQSISHPSMDIDFDDVYGDDTFDHQSAPPQPQSKSSSDGEFQFSSSRKSQSSNHSSPTAPSPLPPVSEDSSSSAVTMLEIAEAAPIRIINAVRRANDEPEIASWSNCQSSKDDPKPIGANENKLTFYYYDAHEDTVNRPGTVFLFGKSLIPGNKTTSTCIQTTGMQRSLYFLPRKFQLAEPDYPDEPLDENAVTDTPVTMADVYAEVESILLAKGVRSLACKHEERNYCFDRDMTKPTASLLDKEEIVPAKTQYLRVEYPFTDAALDRNLVGRTFSRVFGTRTTPLELFLLQMKLMGPCWLSVENIAPTKSLRSHCRHEYVVNDLKYLTAHTNPPQVPLFSSICLSMKTVRSRNDDKTDEIVMISFGLNFNASIDGAGGEDNPSIIETLWRPIEKTQTITTALPNAKRKKPPSKCATERVMLLQFLNTMTRYDPDIVIAHDLHFNVLDLLARRCEALKIEHALRTTIGRYRANVDNRSNWKRNQPQSMNQLDYGYGAGRLQFDTQLMAQEFLTAQKMYTLDELAQSQLNISRNISDKEEDQTINQAVNQSSKIIEALSQQSTVEALALANEADMDITNRLSISMLLFPLTKQLTNLCGNTWSKTLRSKRSERVESLLLHEFYSQQFIIPEKYTSKERQNAADKIEKAKNKSQKSKVDLTELEEDESMTSKSQANQSSSQPNNTGFKKRGKPLYSGGLVLEPKKGFYDKYVLLLDFNSLYPSIIQEYNLCWTTLKHWKYGQAQAVEVVEGEEGEEMLGLSAEIIPPLPEQTGPTGHLPTIISKLVDRRREVKKLMKNERNVAVKNQLEIRQRALKLIANSMYGCLGFTAGRFYCAPLAALVTSQGRGTLSTSVDLANTLGAHVIYGDTDSIMIDTCSSNIEQAIKMGNQISREINKRHKVLVIEIDSIFKNMLLLKKKKYAALKIMDDVNLISLKPGMQLHEKREVKGLDLVRRDWSKLSKDISNKVLNHLLSSKTREQIIEGIHVELDQLGQRARQNQIKVSDFVITKSLTKDPSEYPAAQAASQPHVQVALALRNTGAKVRAGDVISYVICEVSEDQTIAQSGQTLAQRAYHPSIIASGTRDLKIDTKWYLENQVVPPVARLCNVIEELDARRIAHHLGLDASKFKAHQSGENEDANDEDEFMSGTSLNGDPEARFANCTRKIEFECPLCEQTVQFDGAIRVDMDQTQPNTPTSASSGFRCSNSMCKAHQGFFTPEMGNDNLKSIQIRLNWALRKAFRTLVQSYYASTYQCTDSLCQLITRDISTSTRSIQSVCLRDGCSGKLVRKVSHQSVYLQIAWFMFALNDTEQKAKVHREDKKRQVEPRLAFVDSLLSMTELRVMENAYELVEQMFNVNAYEWVSPSVFGTGLLASRSTYQQQQRN